MVDEVTKSSKQWSTHHSTPKMVWKKTFRGRTHFHFVIIFIALVTFEMWVRLETRAKSRILEYVWTRSSRIAKVLSCIESSGFNNRMKTPDLYKICKQL